MVNEKLLLDTLDHIKNNPQSWRQDFWFINFDPDGKEIHSIVTFDVEELNQCGSAFCFAGHAAIKAGAAPPKANEPWHNVWKVDGIDVNIYAADRLGINPEQAEALFDPANDLEDLENMVEAIIADPDISYEELEAIAGRDSDWCCEECSGDHSDDEW